ncbi:VOC family protein [Parasphingopyxis marina]|uniref:VOC family protein n=1 Tax=Parasphingopyxis marina TaxID=2761622 RepID=A0A842I3C7_9SPHN|nr:VOC family protein [Parasphingopyxis marina]MBC2778880.1 VOC family protein [Parasphingopyxis marina]
MQARSPLLSLGYVGVTTTQLDEWASFATDLLGMQIGARDARVLALRTDGRSQRLFVESGEGERVQVMGWEVADGDALAGLATRLSDAGHEVTPGSAELAEQRRVAGLAVAHDPVGNRLEFFHDAADAAEPFAPSRAISGFRTGPLGLGHAVLTVRSVDAILPFYTDLLGFRLSDYALRPFGAYFFHLNSRHHSFAVVETGEDGFHHLMVELNSLDDVGQAYDLAQLEDGRVGVTLGRHSNDFMTSFYARSPSGFMIEYGWGGRSIDPENWEPFECDYGPSLWGHERSWLDNAKRAEARKLRLDAAAQGRRAPDFVRGND